MSRWLRWYEGTTEDGKFKVAARNAGVTVRDVIAVWAFILEDASKDDHRGVCTRNEDFIAAILDFEDGVAEKILAAMESVGMISVGAQNITVSHWKDRQFETDAHDPTNAERQRRFREKNRSNPPNESGTPSKQVRNGRVTASKLPETDTETEQNQNQIEERKIEISENQKSANGAALSEMVAGLVKRASRKPNGSAYLWLKQDDTRVPQAVEWWRKHYGSDPPLRTMDSGKQGYHVPWAAVNH